MLTSVMSSTCVSSSLLLKGFLSLIVGQKKVVSLLEGQSGHRKFEKSRLLTLTLAALMAIYMLVLLGGVFAAFKTSQKDEEGPYLALEELDPAECARLMERDWAADSGGRGYIERQQVLDSWFQLADLHTSGSRGLPGLCPPGCPWRLLGKAQG